MALYFFCRAFQCVYKKLIQDGVCVRVYIYICSCMMLITYCLVYICVCCIWVNARYNVGKIRVFLNFEHVLSPHVIK